MTKGLLFSQMAPPPEWKADFEDWYDHEHIPARMAINGFSHALRYKQDEEPWHLACYFLDDMSALDTPEYSVLKSEQSERTVRMLNNVSGFTRYIADQISDTAAYQPYAWTGIDHILYVVAFSVPEEDRTEFDSWYDEEHVPLLMKVPGWLRVRRYLVRPGSAAGPSWTHLALHEIEERATLDAPQRAAARDTPRRDALAAKPWFSSSRWVYVPISIAYSTPIED